MLSRSSIPVLFHVRLPHVPELEAVILDLLAAHAPTYGLDLVAESNGRLKRGSVYVTLGRMEQKGLVRSRLDERPGEGPARRWYEPTPLGLETEQR